MQFLIIARDGNDENALDRRMGVRPRHLQNMMKLKDEGHVMAAGGLIEDGGRLAGSYLVMDFESREALDDYLKTEPYVTAGVWQDIKIEVCNTVILGKDVIGG